MPKREPNDIGEKILFAAGQEIDKWTVIPSVLVRELLHRICRMPSAERERRVTSQHEAGHVIAVLLEDVDLAGMRISSLQLESIYEINRAFDKKLAHGQMATEKEMSVESKIKIDIAGLAATIDFYPEVKREFLDSFDRIEKSVMRDITRPFEILQQRIEELTGIKVSVDDSPRVKQCLRQILDVMAQFFLDPNFLKCRNVIGHFLSRTGDFHRDGKRVNEDITGILFEAGISPHDLERMRAKFQSIDIDGIIRANFPVPSPR